MDGQICIPGTLGMLKLDKDPGKEEIQVLKTALNTFTGEC